MYSPFHNADSCIGKGLTTSSCIVSDGKKGFRIPDTSQLDLENSRSGAL